MSSYGGRASSSMPGPCRALVQPYILRECLIPRSSAAGLWLLLAPAAAGHGVAQELADGLHYGQRHAHRIPPARPA